MDGVINREGDWVLLPEYNIIHRSYFPMIPAAPFECWKGDNHLQVLDGETYEPLLTLENGSSFGSGLVNPAIMRVYIDGMGSNASYYSLETGEKLFEADDFYDGNASIDGVYRELAEGYPQRLVVEKQSGDDCAYLADNRGNRISDEYDDILPLIWLGGKGLYIAQTYSGQGGVFTSYEQGELYDVREEVYSDDARCGLIDQDGNIIADIEYISLQVISADEIHLTRADGSIETIRGKDWR